MTSGALGATLSANAINAVPPGLAASIISATKAALLLPVPSALYVKIFFKTPREAINDF